MTDVISMSTLGHNGRFGNQIFQYFFLRVYALQHGLMVQTPADWIGRRLYDLDDPPIRQQLPRFIDHHFFDASKSEVVNHPTSLRNTDLWGYFQYHTSYYAPYRELFRSVFQLTESVRPAIDKAWENLRTRGKTIIGLHIRRGDYEDIHLNTHHIIASNQALLQWLRSIWPRCEQPVLYLASDALDRMLPDFAEFSPVTERDVGPGVPWADFLLDFEMLSRCNIVGISNSTFSFAACMFNDNGEFYRPTVDGQMERFEAWNAPVTLRREKRLDVHQTLRVIQEFEKDPAKDPTQTAIRQTRREMVHAWLATPDDLLEVNMGVSLGKLHGDLLATKVRDNPPPPEYPHHKEDEALIEQLQRAIASGAEAPLFLQSLIAAQLMLRPHQLSLAVSLRAIPQWLQQGFLKYLLEQPQVFFETGEADRYHHFLRDWTGEILACHQREPREQHWNTAIRLAGQLINMIPLYFSSENIKGAQQRRAQVVEAALQSVGCELEFTPQPRPTNRKRLKLGILAAHFAPLTETYHMLPAYEFVDRTQIEVVLITPGLTSDPIARYCASRADRLIELTDNVGDQAKLLRDENFDVLVIATNVAAVLNKIAMLCPHRMARVQVMMFSSPCTTGFRNIDYYISGTLSETDHGQEHYTEKLIKLPGYGFCYQYNAVPQPSAQPMTRADMGISEKVIVFASGANYYKITPETTHLWASIIQKVPGSVMLLFPFGPAWNNSYEMNPFLQMIYGIFASYGLGTEQLVVMNSQPSRSAVKECLKVSDVYLDSLRHSGAHSIVDPLELGIPPVTLEGPFLRARHGAGTLRSIGLDELVATDETGYSRLAIELGTNKAFREKCRQQVIAAMKRIPPFLDSKKFAELVTPVYFKMLQEKLDQPS